MLIPYSTDAPLYHLPLATVGLIALNTLVFFAAPETSVEEYALWWGQGLHPVQWITSNFLHGNFLHLLFNMIWLWVFGLIVEGKLGWLRFLAVYFGIGLVQCAAEQTLMLGADPNMSLGASSILYGLMAICLVWAPKNDIHCLFLVSIRPFLTNVSVLVFASIYLGLELFLAIFLREGLGSEVLHLMGAAVGFPVGILLLKKGWVDCENWDVFSLIAGRNTMSRRELAALAERAPERQQQREERRQLEREKIQFFLGGGNPRSALEAHRHMRHIDAGWELPDPPHRALIDSLMMHNQWPAARQLRVEYLRRGGVESAEVRILLAQGLLETENRPGQALAVLAKLSPEIPPHLTSRLTRLRAAAEAAKAREPFEVVGEDW